MFDKRALVSEQLTVLCVLTHTYTNDYSVISVMTSMGGGDCP